MAEPTVIFTLISPKELKDEITDRLMNFDLISGFNLSAIKGYSKAHSSFNLEEQVRGCRELVQFDIIIDSQHISEIKEVLSPISQQTQLRYWLTNITENGHLG
jgi:hypothetical protein